MADLDNQGCCYLLCALGPLPGYAADTAGPQLHRVPVLRVSHTEVEGEADNLWGMYRLGIDMHMGICQGTWYVYRVYTQDTHTLLHMGEMDVVHSVPELAEFPHSTPHPACRPGAP